MEMSTKTNNLDKDLQTQNEKTLSRKENGEEQTNSVRSFVPNTDITENADGLVITMDIPGVKKDNVKIHLDKNILEIEAIIDFEPYKDLKPVYTEYQIGNYTRRFTLSNTIDTEKIIADLENGVLSLTLPKLPEAQPRRIQIG